MGGVGRSSLLRTGSGNGVSLGGRGRAGSWSCVSAGAEGGGRWWGSPCGVSVVQSRLGGRGLIVWGWHCWRRGGAGVGAVLDGSLGDGRVFWVLCVHVVRVSRSLAGRGVGVGGGSGHPGVAVVRRQRAAAGGRCSQAGVAVKEVL